ncbi:hypothetical protein T492DRAFT_894492 [Pavlovales sp. CCMP2436]|nr:hypothetical protein T492DRAFT_894492 [Pavlovales sp. CCMP2436]
MSLLVPVALWPRPPAHDVTAVHASGGSPPSVIASGSRSGQMCLWVLETCEHRAAAPEQAAGVDGRLVREPRALVRLQPRAVLIGHNRPIVAIDSVLFDRGDALLALSSDGMLSEWDPVDGRCLISTNPSAPLGGDATALAVLPGRRHAAYGGRFGLVHIVEVTGLTLVTSLTGAADGCLALCARSLGAHSMDATLASAAGAAMLAPSSASASGTAATIGVAAVRA